MYKDLKYITAYLIPFSAVFSLMNESILSYTTVIIIFGLVPFIEVLLPKNETPYDQEEKNRRNSNRLFDYLLYLNLLFVYVIIGLFIYTITNNTYTNSSLIGWILSTGIVLGSSGINVAHELGHRKNKKDQFLAKILLLPNFYMHFFIEHNKGHHRYVSTPKDPATARYNEVLYVFWVRSIVQSYFSAWRIQLNELAKKNTSFLSFKNEMLLYHIAQTIYLLIIFYVTNSFQITIYALAIGFVGILLLETINYIEHYGLVRKQIGTDRWEKVQPWHSWNANYEVGRILLYELTRHSDHHYKSTKKYQTLEHQIASPQLPLGYPGSMLMALIPPLWFWVMNPRIPNQA
jgi:alkane 1-monooxygenase